MRFSLRSKNTLNALTAGPLDVFNILIWMVERKEKLPWTPPRASISLVIIPLAGDCQMMDYKGKEALLTYF